MWCQLFWEGRARDWGELVLFLYFVRKSPSSETVSAIQRSAVNLKSNTTKRAAVLGGEAERCHS